MGKLGIMKRNVDYELTKDMISQIRNLNESKKSEKVVLSEEKDSEDNGTAIAITNDPRFGQNVLKNEIDSFKKSVDGGAKFSDENSTDAESNPMVYYPKTGNLVFSGSIPSLSELKFQFSLNDITGAPYIFVDGLALTEDVVTTLHKLSGYYKNWRDSWNSATDLLDKLKKEENK